MAHRWDQTADGESLTVSRYGPVEIPIARPRSGLLSHEAARAALRRGYAVQFYCGYTDARALAARIAGPVLPVDVWYTERNGDPIAMMVPAGTPAIELPSRALDYMALRWIAPEDDFDGPTQSVPARFRECGNAEATRDA